VGCGLVVEAVPEDLPLKIEALGRIEATIAPGSAHRIQHLVSVESTRSPRR
jgi:hypothetical protein